MKKVSKILLIQGVTYALFFSSFNTLFCKRNRHRQQRATNYEQKRGGSSSKSHKSSSFQRFSSVNGKTERINISYSSNITLSDDDGVKEHLKSQLDLKSMNDQKEILIESLQGKNDFPAHLKIASNNDNVILKSVIISINGPSIRLAFSVNEEGSAYEIAYDVNELSFDRALKRIQTINTNDHISRFKEKVTNMPTQEEQSMEGFQQNIQSQMNEMKQKISNMMQEMNKAFKDNA